MKRRFLSVMIAMIMVFSLFPSMSFAADLSGDTWPAEGPTEAVNYLTIDSGKSLAPTNTITVNDGVTLYVRGGGKISGGNPSGPVFQVESGGRLILDKIEITGNTVGEKGAVYVKDGGTLQIGEAVGISGNTKNLVITQNATVSLTAAVTKSIGFTYDGTLTKPVSIIKGSNLYDIQESDLAAGKLHLEGSSMTEVICNHGQVLLHNSSKLQVLFWSPLDSQITGLDGYHDICLNALKNYSDADIIQLSGTKTERAPLPNDIEKYDLIYILFPTSTSMNSSADYYQGEIDRLTAYLNDGGRIFIQSEARRYTDLVNTTTKLAGDCGAEFTIGDESVFEPTGSGCTNGTSSLNTNVTGFAPYVFTPIYPKAGAKYDVVFYSNQDGTDYAWMVDQQAGVREDGKKYGRITVSTDVNCWEAHWGSTETGVRQFLTNLCEDTRTNRLAAAAGYNPNVVNEVQAKIDTTDYSTVQDALASVSAGKTIVLQRDNSLTAAINKPLPNSAAIQQANGGPTFTATTTDPAISVSSTGAITLLTGGMNVSASGSLALASGYTVTSAAAFHAAIADDRNNTDTNPNGASVTATEANQVITVTSSAGKTYTFTAAAANDTFYIGEYNVTSNLDHAAIDGTAPALPCHTGTYEVTLAPAANYDLKPENVTVAMGGTALTGVCTQDGSKVKVKVTGVSGSIVITAEGQRQMSEITATITGSGSYTAKDAAGNTYTPDASHKISVPRNEEITLTFAPTDSDNFNSDYQNEPDTFSVPTALTNGGTSVFDQDNWNWTDKTYTYTFTPTAATHTLAATFQKRHAVRVHVSNGTATLPSGLVSTTEGTTYRVLVPEGGTPQFTFTADAAITTPLVENAFWKTGSGTTNLKNTITSGTAYTTPAVTAPACLSVTFTPGETVTVSVTGGTQQIPTGESWTEVSTTDTTTIKKLLVAQNSNLAITVMPEENTVIHTLKLDTTDRDPSADLERGTLVKNADGSYTFHLQNIETHHELVFKFVNYGTLSSTTSTVTVTNPKASITYEIFDRSGNKVGVGVSTDGSEIVFPGLPAGKPYTVKAIDGKTVTVGSISTKPTSHSGDTSKPDDPDDTGISDWLITEEHPVYLNGYPSGLFAPDGDMTRAEAAQIFYNLLLNKDVPVTVAFTDVPAGAWYEQAVNVLGSVGVIQGVGNGRFAPEDRITRAEFTAMAMRFTKQATGGENLFSDVTEDDWYYDYVVGSIRYGWIGGYPDGTFRPQNRITRAEAAAIVNRMLARTADEAFIHDHPDRLRQFTDLSDAHWAYLQILEASTPHKYTKPNGIERWY